MTFNPRRSVFTTLLALMATSATVLLSGAVAAQAATVTTTSVLAAAKKDIAKEKSVHVVAMTLTGKTSSSLVADIGATSGTESYKAGKQSFTISVTSKYAYLKGSYSGLTTLMGLSATEAKTVGKKWMAMKKGTPPYSTFESNLTSSAFKNVLPPAKGTTLLSARDKKTGGYQLSWIVAKTTNTPKSKNVLTISAGALALPQRESVTTSSASSETTYSKWGEKVNFKIPTKTVSYAKVFP